MNETPARRGRPGYDQATVLRVAIDLFNRQGYEGTSMGDLASELGLSKAAIYHHVSGKEALLEAALHEALDGLGAAVADAVAARGSAEDRLRTTVATSVRILAGHLPAVTLLLRVRGNSDLERWAVARRREIDEQLAGLVAAAVAEGALGSGLAPELASRLVFGAVNSLVEWWRPQDDVDIDAMADAVTAGVCGGLSGPASRPAADPAAHSAAHPAAGPATGSGR